jgi:DNA-binding transcriptional MerR regulator
MTEKHFFILRVRTERDFSGYYTLSEVAYRAGLHPELIDRFMRLGLIEFSGSTNEGEPLFDPEVIPLIKRILRLRNQLGVNYAGIGVVLELMSRLEHLEARLRELESE